MSFHSDPKTTAEHLAKHLEVNYGLQLDAARHNALLEDIESFFPAVVAEVDSPVIAEVPAPVAIERKPRGKKEKR